MSESYQDKVLHLLQNEDELRVLLACSLLAHHSQEVKMVEKMAQARGGDDNLEKIFYESLRNDIIGGSQLVMFFAEAYRLLVDRGDIEPINAIEVAKRLHLTRSTARTMAKDGEAAFARSPLNGVLKEEELTLKGMSSPVPSDDETTNTRNLAQAIIKKGMKQTKKDLEDD